MNYGFEDGKFYVDYVGASRPVGNIRQEALIRAREIADTHKNIILGFSGGLDSQLMLHSFREIGADVETAFLHYPGFNDNELEQVEFLNRKYKIDTLVIELNPLELKDEIIQLSKDTDIPGKNHLIHSMFLSMLPDDATFVQMIRDPYCRLTQDYKGMRFYFGYYIPEMNRKRAFDRIKRSGSVVYFDDTPEYFLSLMSDKIFEGAHRAGKYFDENGLEKKNMNLKQDDRWDFYIKPIMYGAYWGDELTYFPKFQGFENLDYLYGNPVFGKHATVIWYRDLMEILKTPGMTKRVYENFPFSDK